ncbi:MAG: FIST C-terminal domain-containing protein [Treponema sp.]|jgi:hypothetical protein|nr:FIST C-terminal domain-containing protein [Treponema sp.]
MIKVIVASTIEAADIDFAIKEITSRIKTNEPLLRNTVGLLFCNLEFIQSGLVRELCARMSFDIVGCTSQIFAVQNAGEEFMLTLMVLTSDDVEFYAGVSESLSQGKEAVLESFYRDLLARGKNPSLDPALMLAFPPHLSGIPGNKLVDVLNDVSGGVPVFGSVAIDITTSMRSPMTIFNGSPYPDRLTMVLLRGNVQPRFFSHSLPGEPHLNQKFTITKAQGNKIFSIENKPALEYMEELGLVNQAMVDVFYAFPIVVDYHDGTEPRIFTISKIDVDGALVCEQEIPLGGTANIGTISGELVMASTRAVIKRIRETTDRSGLILVSCFSRVLTLHDSLEEVNLVIRQMRDTPMPFVFFSSAGEICPISGTQGELQNSFHQFTIIACVL